MLWLTKFINFWFPVLVYSGIIYTVSAIPQYQSPIDVPNFDKAIHLVEYAPWGFLLARALNTNLGHLDRKRLWGFVLLFSFLYGVSDEFHQMFVPGRDASWLDVTADVIGGGLGGWIFLHFRNKRK